MASLLSVEDEESPKTLGSETTPKGSGWEPIPDAQDLDHSCHLYPQRMIRVQEFHESSIVHCRYAIDHHLRSVLRDRHHPQEAAQQSGVKSRK